MAHAVIPVLSRALMHPDNAGCFFPALSCGSELEELFALSPAAREGIQAGFAHPLNTRVNGEAYFSGGSTDALQPVEGFEEGVLLLLGVFRLGLAASSD